MVRLFPTTRKGASLVGFLGLLSVGLSTALLCGVLAGDSRASGFALAGLGAPAIAAVLVRCLSVPAERTAWLAIAAALTANLATDVLVVMGGSGGGGEVPETILGIGAFAFSIAALVLLVSVRLGRLPAIAWTDGLIGALALQTLLAVTVLAAAARGDSADSTELLFPMLDLLVVGFVAAAVAQGKWRLDAWMPILLGLALFTVGDSISAARIAEGSGSGGGAAVVWIAGAWSLALASWAPPPAPTTLARGERPLVPVLLSLSALALLLLATLAPDPWGVSICLAVAGMLAVVDRFVLTLGQNARVLAASRQEALTDALTGLGNRRQLAIDLGETLADCDPAAPCALALFDLNGFKSYNDTYGHPAGDALLETLGRRLSEAVAGEAEAYRIGGDEFCLLVGAGVREAPESIAGRAAASLEVVTRDFRVDAAFGLVRLPGDAADADEALRLADLRMYEDKNQGRMGPARQVAGALMLAAEERSRDRGPDAVDVPRLAAEIARRLGMDEAGIERSRLTALLRNVGQIAIPDAILGKPGPLDQAEWKMMRRRSEIGQRIIESAPALEDVAVLVRSVPERFDGRGYPDGLLGEAIPLGSRVVAVCDAYAAMLAPRPYRGALRAEDAFAEVVRCAGTQFDPLVVAAFRREVDRPRAPVVPDTGSRHRPATRT